MADGDAMTHLSFHKLSLRTLWTAGHRHHRLRVRHKSIGPRVVARHSANASKVIARRLNRDAIEPELISAVMQRCAISHPPAKRGPLILPMDSIPFQGRCNDMVMPSAATD